MWMDLFRSVIDKNKFSALTACEKSQTFQHANFAGAKLDNFLAKRQCRREEEIFC